MIKKHREGVFEDSFDFKGYVGLLSIDDIDLKAELKAMEGDEALMEDAFYKNLSFGRTGGIQPAFKCC